MYISRMCQVPLSSVVGDHIVDRLFTAQSISEQREVFTSLPLDKIEPIVRCGLNLGDFKLIV